MITEEEYWFWLCSTDEIWQQDIEKLLKKFDSPEDVFKTSEEQLAASECLSSLQLRNLLKSRKEMTFRSRLEKLKKDNVKFIYFESPGFPERLKTIPDHPYALYVKGNLPDQSRISIGMVGARACSKYGREMAQLYASALAKEGMQVISGMAIGIDAISARAAMEAGGTTFAVLGSGIDVIYPAANIDLYYEIIMRGGGIISEYAPQVKAIAWHFPHRNRIITGLSDKLLIFEGRKNSGTLTTAGHALDQGVDIYALPGRVGDPLSEGPNQLINDGAGMLISVRYLLDDIYGSSVNNRKKQPDQVKTAAAVEAESTENKKPRAVKPVRRKIPPKAGGEYAHVISVLEKGMATAETIGDKTGIHEPHLSQLLCEMEIMGLIRQQGKDCYIL